MKPLEAVIFDYSTLLVNDPATLADVRLLIANVKQAGLKIVVFSMEDRDMNAELGKRDLPPCDLFLCSRTVGAKKGAKQWIDYTADNLHVPYFRLLYVGDDFLDWRTAINSGVFFIHAEWSKPYDKRTKAVRANSPFMLWLLLTQFHLQPPRWEYTLDVPEQHLTLRSLLAFRALIPATSQKEFMLQDVFTRHHEVKIGNTPAQTILVMHAISSLYTEGLIRPNCVFCIYPSSTPGHASTELELFVEPAARYFHGYYRRDLLIRAVPAIDTSIARVNKQETPITIQTDSVHVAPSYENLLAGKQVIVFDDFATRGYSFEWARNLLDTAGAGQVIGVTIGKYGWPPVRHHAHLLRSSTLRPFELTKYDTKSTFRVHEYEMARNEDAQSRMRVLLDAWIAGKPAPLP